MKKVLVVILGVSLAACGSGGSEATTTTRSASATTTSTAPTTAPAPIYAVADPSLNPPGPTDDSDGAAGSGCPEGGGPPADGIWYGYVSANAAEAVTFELACFYTGDRAIEEAAADGAEAPNDFYIHRTGEISEVPVAGDASAYTVVAPPNAELTVETIGFSEWPQDPIGYTPCPGEFCSVWLYINNGVVTELLEQYLP